MGIAAGMCRSSDACCAWGADPLLQAALHLRGSNRPVHLCAVQARVTSAEAGTVRKSRSLVCRQALLPWGCFGRAPDSLYQQEKYRCT